MIASRKNQGFKKQKYSVYPSCKDRIPQREDFVPVPPCPHQYIFSTFLLYLLYIIPVFLEPTEPEKRRVGGRGTRLEVVEIKIADQCRSSGETIKRFYSSPK